LPKVVPYSVSKTAPNKITKGLKKVMKELQVAEKEKRKP